MELKAKRKRIQREKTSREQKDTELVSLARVNWRALVALCKPKITALSTVAVAVAYYLSASVIAVATLTFLLSGTALVVAGAAAFNMYWEEDTDGAMERTQNRPLPRGEISSAGALTWSLILFGMGLALLAWGTNLLTVGLALLGGGGYGLLYTPLKSKTHWAFVVGLIPGAVPPLMGGAAATGTLEGASLYLFGIFLFWQIPHVMALYIRLEEDYTRGGLVVFPRRYGEDFTCFISALGAIFLLWSSLLPVLGGAASWFYGIVIFAAGAYYLGLHIPLLKEGGDKVKWARKSFVYSLCYITLLLITWLVDSIVMQIS